MPAITSLTISAAAPLGRVLSVLAGRARRALKQLAEKVKSRRDAMRLAELDDRMLADIGLTRSELPFIAGELVSGARMSAKQVSPGFRTRPECGRGRAGFAAAARSYPVAAGR